MKFFYTILILSLLGCQSKSKIDLPSESKKTNSINREETKVFGDSLKIVYEYRGDTVIQTRIDLKGTSDDGFDDSFTIYSIWSTKNATKLNCEQKLTLVQDKIVFKFCLNDVLKKVEMDIENSKEKPWNLDGLNKIERELIQIKKGEIDRLSVKTYYFTFDLLRNINFSIYEIETKSNIEKVRIERYKTNFSGGRNYYLIDKKNDTIARFDVNEWIS